MSLRLLRLVLALALALAVPLQGFAAAAAGLCMGLDHHDAPVHAHDGAEQPDDHHSHDAHDTGAGDPHCAPCSACCSAAAISSFTPLVLADKPAARLDAAGPPLFLGIQADTLDRPPLAL